MIALAGQDRRLLGWVVRESTAEYCRSLTKAVPPGDTELEGSDGTKHGRQAGSSSVPHHPLANSSSSRRPPWGWYRDHPHRASHSHQGRSPPPIVAAEVSGRPVLS